MPSTVSAHSHHPYGCLASACPRPSLSSGNSERLFYRISTLLGDLKLTISLRRTQSKSISSGRHYKRRSLSTSKSHQSTTLIIILVKQNGIRSDGQPQTRTKKKSLASTRTRVSQKYSVSHSIGLSVSQDTKAPVTEVVAGQRGTLYGITLDDLQGFLLSCGCLPPTQLRFLLPSYCLKTTTLND